MIRLWMVLPVLMIAAGSGCTKCNRTGMTISADAKQTSITVPPGGGARSFVEVIGRGFEPNAAMTISMRNLPTADPARSTFTSSATTDSGGDLYWHTDLSSLGAMNRSADPNVDVWITARENDAGCFATASIKTGRILRPPQH